MTLGLVILPDDYFFVVITSFPENVIDLPTIKVFLARNKQLYNLMNILYFLNFVLHN